MRKLAVLLLLVTGCTSNLDKSQFEVRQSAYASRVVFYKAVDNYIKGTGEIADKKFLLEKTVNDKDWQEWLDKHTDENGGLVSKDATGKIVPMPVTQLTLALDNRNQNIIKLEDGKKSWDSYQNNMKELLTKQTSFDELCQSKDFDYQKAKESAQAILDASLNSIGSLAAGLGISFAL